MRGLPERARNFFREVHEPADNLADLVDQARLDAMLRMDPEALPTNEIQVRLVGPLLKDGFYDSHVEEKLAGPLGKQFEIAAGSQAEARMGLVAISPGSVILTLRPHNPFLKSGEARLDLDASSLDVGARKVIDLYGLLDQQVPPEHIRTRAGSETLLRQVKQVVAGLSEFSLEMTTLWHSPSRAIVRSRIGRKGVAYANGLFMKESRARQEVLSGMVWALDLDGILKIRDVETSLKVTVRTSPDQARRFQVNQRVRLLVERAISSDQVGLKAKDVVTLIEIVEDEALPL